MVDRTAEVAEFRRKLATKSTEQIVSDLARSIYGGPDAWKVVIAHDVLQEKRQAEERRHREDERVRVEQGEIATLQERITTLEEELQDKNASLRQARIGLALTGLAAAGAIFAALGAWREPLKDFFGLAVLR